MHRASEASTSNPSSTPHGHASNGGSAASPAGVNGGGGGPQPAEVNTDGHVCPFCGLTREITEDFDATSPCPRCTLADTPTTRNATKARIGPWHVRQMRNPWAPGMRWETLIALIKRGQVTKDSIVRGPTTHQLWRRASEIKGLSREFGLCYSCGGEIDTQANLCGHCNRLQEPPVNPNVLVETREFAQQGQAAVAPVPQQPVAKAQATRPASPAPATSLKPAPAAGNGDAFDEPPHIDIGASTPPAEVDPDAMLTVDDPEHAAALARSITSRAPTRPPRVHPATPQAPAASASVPTPAPAAPNAPRPMTLRPRQPGADDALLTPQELAAAFQLNFAPAGGSAEGPAAAPASAPSIPLDEDFFAAGSRPRKRSKLLAVFLLLLLIAAGGAVLGYLRPDLRDRAEAWSENTYASVKQFIASRTAPASNKPTLEPVPSPTTRPAGIGSLAQRPPAATRPAPIVIAPQVPSPMQEKVAVVESPAPQPASQTTSTPPGPAPVSTARETTRELEPILETPEPPKAAAPETAASKSTTPTPTPAAPVVEPKPAASAPATAKPTPKVWASLSEAEDEARRLWVLAIDAEQNQDFVEAVKCYEQIKKLPAEVQPGGIDVRLSLAKKLTK